MLTTAQPVPELHGVICGGMQPADSRARRTTAITVEGGAGQQIRHVCPGANAGPLLRAIQQERFQAKQVSNSIWPQITNVHSQCVTPIQVHRLKSVMVDTCGTAGRQAFASPITTCHATYSEAISLQQSNVWLLAQVVVALSTYGFRKKGRTESCR